MTKYIETVEELKKVQDEITKNKRKDSSDILVETFKSKLEKIGYKYKGGKQKGLEYEHKYSVGDKITYRINIKIDELYKGSLLRYEVLEVRDEITGITKELNIQGKYIKGGETIFKLEYIKYHCDKYGVARLDKSIELLGGSVEDRNKDLIKGVLSDLGLESGEYKGYGIKLGLNNSMLYIEDSNNRIKGKNLKIPVESGRYLGVTIEKLMKGNGYEQCVKNVKRYIKVVKYVIDSLEGDDTVLSYIIKMAEENIGVDRLHNINMYISNGKKCGLVVEINKENEGEGYETILYKELGNKKEMLLIGSVYQETYGTRLHKLSEEVQKEIIREYIK